MCGSHSCGSHWCSSHWMALAAFLAVIVLSALRGANACVFLLGESPDSVVNHPELGGYPYPDGTSPWIPAPSSLHWTYGFRGDDWEGTCANGTMQSPINLHMSGDATMAGDAQLASRWSYTPSNASSDNPIAVYNTGHTVQVQWKSPITSNATIAAAGGNVLDVLAAGQEGTPVTSFSHVEATPLQLHFHTSSEHTVDGVYYPLELHIVHKVTLPQCPESGCLSVTGVLFKLSDDDADNPALETIWKHMPKREGLVNTLADGEVLDIEALLPTDRSYVQYGGSLTTPPCSEGLLWHVFSTPQTISLKQLKEYSEAVGLKNCTSAGETATGGRRLLSKGVAAKPFVRGSLTGYVNMAEKAPAHGRGLLQTPGPDDYTCTLVSLGFTNRNPQSLNDRVVYSFSG